MINFNTLNYILYRNYIYTKISGGKPTTMFDFFRKRNTGDDLKDIYKGVTTGNTKKAREIIMRREKDVEFQVKVKNIIEDAKGGRKFKIPTW